ncbi:hypothetical protein [Salinibacillus xinjiangensis]|uniref:DUF4181 domain-containing protein n=1 Tax=Salinibacillus xinjiangensis TaxID=1229268 RepID=A0A6G1X5L2_9BACI|nr:hypothetical protein [Salinibacillus xinjiangensis]MRG86254.1 hypothetical protein [Salinibacillus xinjiangensis]
MNVYAERKSMMRHQAEKFFQYQYLSLFTSFLFGVLALWQSDTPLFFLFAFYALSLSFMFEGLAYQSRRNHVQFVEQIIRALLIFLLSSFLYF